MSLYFCFRGTGPQAEATHLLAKGHGTSWKGGGTSQIPGHEVKEEVAEEERFLPRSHYRQPQAEDPSSLSLFGRT